MAQLKSWLGFKSPEYTANIAQWGYTRDHYTGRLLTEGVIENYLFRRKLGEPVEAYGERCRLADYTPHLSSVIDALAGMLFQAEAKAKRTFVDPASGKGLGDPLVKDTVMSFLWDDADGAGIGWVTLWRQAAIELIMNRLIWVVVDPTSKGSPRVRIIPASAVTNCVHQEGRVIEANVMEVRDLRTTVEDKPVLEPTIVRYQVDGWSRWREDKDGNPVQMAAGSYKYVDRAGRGALPIFPVRLPMARNVGYMLARKANAIFNKESERDFLQRVSSFPLLVVQGGDELVENLKKALTKGERVIQSDPSYPGGHSFISPDSGPVASASDTLNRKVEEFYKSAFREYADAAIERSATEVRQDVASGVGAFLTMLKAAVDEAENGAIWRLEQQQSQDKASWFIGRVERPDTFLPIDIESQTQALADRYAGQGQSLPVGEGAQVEALKKILEYDGLPYNEDEIRAGVRLASMTEMLQAMSVLPVPPDALAELTVRLLGGLGVVDLDSEIEMGDGEMGLLRDSLLLEARIIARSQADAKQRQSESFGAF